MITDHCCRADPAPYMCWLASYDSSAFRVAESIFVFLCLGFEVGALSAHYHHLPEQRRLWLLPSTSPGAQTLSISGWPMVAALLN